MPYYYTEKYFPRVGGQRWRRSIARDRAGPPREGDADFLGAEQGQELLLVGKVVAGVYLVAGPILKLYVGRAAVIENRRILQFGAVDWVKPSGWPD